MNEAFVENQMFCTSQELAELFNTELGERVLHSLRRLKSFNKSNLQKEEQLSEDLKNESIGIWERSLSEGEKNYYVRANKYLEEWHYWADRESIGPKGFKKRILLLGESVARGYFYDPYFSPATYLEKIINGTQGNNYCDVVDLARIDITAKGLCNLIAAIPQLEPDIILLFAGNNWINAEELTSSAFQELADSLRKGGYPSSRELYLKKFLPTMPVKTLDLLAKVAKENGIPVIILVPEFNLHEWRNELASVAPLLKNEENQQWMQFKKLALNALSNQKWEEAIKHASKMINLDNGSSSLSQDIIGRCKVELGELSEARKYFQASRDAVCGIALTQSPRCPEVIQDILRKKAQQHGFKLIDLPKVFEEYLNGELPDKRLFLDYCHLNTEGIMVAVHAVLEEIYSLFGIEDSREIPHFRSSQVSPLQEATAHFLAAIHNAHYGQPASVLKYHCKKALDFSLDIKEIMMAYIDSQLRKPPFWLCKGYEIICNNKMASRYLSPRNNITTTKLADFKLINTILESLKEKEIDFSSQYHKVLISEHAHLGSVDLLIPFYRSTTFRESAGDFFDKRSYCLFNEMDSQFYIISQGNVSLQLRLTCRIRGDSQDPVIVKFNNSIVHSLVVKRTWDSYEFIIPAKSVNAGVNSIQLEWPFQQFDYEKEIEWIARRLEKTESSFALPVYGEIQSFSASF